MLRWDGEGLRNQIPELTNRQKVTLIAMGAIAFTALMLADAGEQSVNREPTEPVHSETAPIVIESE